jgi:hypothetical protein
MAREVTIFDEQLRLGCLGQQTVTTGPPTENSAEHDSQQKRSAEEMWHNAAEYRVNGHDTGRIPRLPSHA